MIGRYLLEPQGGEGDGTGATTADQGEARGPDLNRAAESLVAKHGDSTAALLVLLGENHRHRDQIRELKAKAPAEGSVVLAGDDARHWSQYRELGKPTDLRTALGERDTFKAEAGSLRKADTIRSAAEVTLIDGSKLKASVLATLAEKLEIEVAEEKGKDGKAVRVARVKGEGDQSTPLSEYAETHWRDFLPSLKAEPAPRTGTPAVQRPRTVPAGPGGAERRKPTSFL